MGQNAESLVKRLECIVGIQALLTITNHPQISTPQGKKFRDNLEVVMNSLKEAEAALPKEFLERARKIIDSKKAPTKKCAAESST